MAGKEKAVGTGVSGTLAWPGAAGLGEQSL